MRDGDLAGGVLTRDERAALEAVLRPVDDARGLANRWYTDPAAFADERGRVFARSWAAIGFAHDAATPGDAVPITFMGVPLLLVRQQDGTLAVYQNVCRHRGMILVPERTTLSSVITCPYHGWCYGLDGRLRGTPHVGGAGENSHPVIERPDLGLIAVRSHIFMGVVFVNLDGAAPEFDVMAAELRDRWADFVDRPIHFSGPDSTFTLELATNWKLAIENYCESYHLPWVHPSLNTYSRLEDHENILSAGAFSGQRTNVYNPVLSEAGAAFPAFSHLADCWSTGAEYVALYPNVLLGVHRDHTYAIMVEPVAPDRTLEHVAIFYTEPAACAPDLADLRQTNTALWKAIFEEDITVVEGMQSGRAAPDFDGGRFSPPMDCATHAFHAWVAERLLAD